MNICKVMNKKVWAVCPKGSQEKQKVKDAASRGSDIMPEPQRIMWAEKWCFAMMHQSQHMKKKYLF